MGLENQPFETTPLGAAAEAASAEALMKAEEQPAPATEYESEVLEVEGETVKVFPSTTDQFTLYVRDCVFKAEKAADGSVQLENDTPEDIHGSWRAPQLKPIAEQALEEYLAA